MAQRWYATTPRALAGAALVGSASGLRSQTGLAAVLVGVPRRELPAWFGHRAVRPLSVLLAAAELVADMYPSAPPRTQAAGLIPRIALGGLSAGLLARRTGGPVILPAAVGAGAAVGAAFGGLAARTRLSSRLSPVVAALIEDLVAVNLAANAVQPTSPNRGQ